HLEEVYGRRRRILELKVAHHPLAHHLELEGGLVRVGGVDRELPVQRAGHGRRELHFDRRRGGVGRARQLDPLLREENGDVPFTTLALLWPQIHRRDGGGPAAPVVEIEGGRRCLL